MNTGVEQQPVVASAEVAGAVLTGPGSGLPKLEREIGRDFARFLVSALAAGLLQGRRGSSSP